MDANQAKRYRGQIVMNTEEELFFPTLTAGRTMDFATRLKVPETLPKDAESREAFPLPFSCLIHSPVLPTPVSVLLSPLSEYHLDDPELNFGASQLSLLTFIYTNP